ncbi:hypothetical protein [Virgisporangium aurantiacum]|uniref:hypothetical protein n=1 Tax=Virgisporangium aurantiacum TaxID=175570 RepID=UPI00194DC2F6|nr:hypothetical protein [Virgisporangium aurantiacum]
MTHDKALGTVAQIAVVAASFLAVAGPAGAAPTGVTVRSETGWQPTGIRVDTGQTFRVGHRSGDWTVGSPGLPRVGPAGYTPEVDRQIYQGCKILTDQPYGRLLARIGDGPPFVVPTDTALTAPAAGDVAFRIHDDDRCLGDNAGALDLTVDTTTAADPGGTATVLYAADWSSGLGGWVGHPSWKVLRGVLVNDGTSGSLKPLLAPYDTEQLADYAIEAKIRVVRGGGCCRVFGLAARRGTGGGGYAGVVRWDGATLISENDDNILEYGEPFAPESEWHTYRLEVDGNVVTFLVDGAKLKTVTDNRHLTGGLTGLISAEYQLEVATYRVLRLN